MLGIFGNLMSDTFAHGAAVSMCVRGADEDNTAGDDGLLIKRDDTADEIEMVLDALGDCEMTKTFDIVDPEDASICLKRPISVVDGTIVHGIAIIPPSITLFRHHILKEDDPRYSFFDEGLDDRARVSIVGKDMMRFLRSAHRAQWRLSDDEVELVMDTLRGAMRHIKIPVDGGLPQCGRSSYFFPCATQIDEFRQDDPILSLAARHFTGHVTIPLVEKEEMPLVSEVLPGDRFRGNGGKLWKLLEILGHVTKDEIRVELSGQDALDHLIRLYTEKHRSNLYEFHIVSDIPTVFSLI